NFHKPDRSIVPPQLRERSGKRLSMPSRIHSSLGRLGVAGLLALVGLFLGGLAGTAAPKQIKFDMVHAQATCLLHARAQVQATSLGPVEEMDVDVSGLPPNTDFDFFVIQVPKGPFGLAWYQGNSGPEGEGEAPQPFMGLLSFEPFLAAPGIAPPPVVHAPPPFPDANSNPMTAPVHTFHLGLWFNSPKDAVVAGCPGATT